MKFSKLILATFALGASLSAECQVASSEIAQQKIEELEQIIERAESKKICTLKERTTVRTAEIFLRYAQWDEENIERNTHHFSLVHRYKTNAEEMAKLLPEFEREDIIAMLDTSIAELSSVMDGKTQRYYSPDVDWSKTSVNGDEILYNGKPVFLSDWTWKPEDDFFNEYHGAQDGFFLTPPFVINEQGDIDPSVIADLEAKESGNMGFVFMNHKGFPQWAIDKDSTVLDGPGLAYTTYDINNPLAREVWSKMFAKVVPMMKGKNYTKLGYMLCNEPHWNTIEGQWTAGVISDKAIADFKVWLKAKHRKISRLNELWGTDFKNFDEIDSPNIMTAKQQGTPIYFDFLSYNMNRVTEWFTFLDSEIKKHDKEALTHIKIMPNLWSDGKRDSGIDMEALTMLTDIIGNDAGSCGAWMYGAPHWWEEKYSYDWSELLMAQDFYKSVSPEKLMYNTEGHFLSTNHYRDLYQTKEYTRQNYWMAHIHGLTAMQTWYWCRTEEGDSRSHEDTNGYAGSNNHQPRVVNEVHQTMADLNSISDDIMSFQRQDKDIRIFYTKASSINSLEYIDKVRECYEKLMFSGIPLGFATEKIINNQDNDSWKVIVIENTPEVFAADVKALQKYINRGGIVIMDNKSLLTNEYGEKLDKGLKDSRKGELIVCENPTDKALSLNIDTKLKVAQSGGTCIWRVIERANGTKLLNIANLGKEKCLITIRNNDGSRVKSAKNALTGEEYTDTFVIPVFGTEVIEVSGSLPSFGENIYNGKGRIALSSDGNMHDNDDMQATMMTLMILAKAGLQPQTTLYTYADHIWGSEKNDLEIMRNSAEGIGAAFNFDKTNFMAAVENPEAAYNAMRDEILKSTATDPLFIIAAGPMQVVGEAIDRAAKVNKDALSYVTVISHSIWNNQHADKYRGPGNIHGEEPPHSGWTWDKMKAKYADRVNFHLISDQNGTGEGGEVYKTKDKFAAPSWDAWDWMRTHTDKNVRLVYETARKNPAGPDFSDAGLAYYFCADLDGERADEMGNPVKLEKWFLNYNKNE